MILQQQESTINPVTSSIQHYFLQCTRHEIVFATIDGKAVTAQERFSLNATCALSEIDPKEVELLLVPDGDISSIANEEVYSFIRAVVDNKHLVAGICNGVDELDNAGILNGIESTHSVKEDLVIGEYVITARGYRTLLHNRPCALYPLF